MMIKSILKTTSAFLLLSMAMSSQTAFAATSEVTPAEVTIQGGALSIYAPAATVDFGTVTINGIVQILNQNLSDITIEDFTGTGNGWNVTVQASQFTDGSNSLPLSSLAINGVGTITPVNTASGLPTVVGVPPYVIDGGGAVKVLTAAVNDGMGEFTVGFPVSALELVVDTSVVKASVTPYASTMTWSVVVGP